ncbi:unnamed protein product [Plutella xylostella]|uniref:(diamondback moth) hypothetical protein n=1 Tax=Plutella xylostella TaxID=51655 RepID=A0A8S4EKB9_PLUXY|nr:unnamed protein product [Plutella xylostella]
MNTSTKSNALSTDLNSFIYGVSRRNFQNAPELTKIGITLLKNFPAARDAVLEYFAMVFHEAVNVSLNQSDYEQGVSPRERVDEVSCTYLVAGGSSGDQEKAAGFQTLAWRHVLDRSEIRAIQSTAALNTHTGILRLAVHHE